MIANWSWCQYITRRPAWQVGIGIAVAVAAVYLVVALYIRWWGMPGAVFVPSEARPVDYGPQSRIYAVTAADGSAIEVTEVGDAASQRVTLYLYGRSGRTAQIITAATASSLVVSPAYPGYYGSAGTPSPEGMLLAADAAMNDLLQRGVKPASITVVGHSLGAYPALHLASRYPDASGYILINPVESPRALCTARYGILCALAGDYASPSAIAPSAQGRVAVYYARNDEYILESQVRALYGRIGSQHKTYHQISGTHDTFDTDAILRAEAGGQ